MELKVFILIATVMCSVTSSVPLHQYNSSGGVVLSKAPVGAGRSLWKRFTDTSSSAGALGHNGIGKMRTKRSSEEQCEQQQLCRLHARSATSFLAAFELYFVNKENARLWDHRARSPADCERRFPCD